MDLLLDGLALQDAVETALQGADHASRICRLPAGSWQARVLAERDVIPKAYTPGDLRKMMADPEVKIIFVPSSAILPLETIELICTESALAKTVIREMD